MYGGRCNSRKFEAYRQEVSFDQISIDYICVYNMLCSNRFMRVLMRILRVVVNAIF